MESKLYNGKSFKINDRGFWESNDSSGHVHDNSLCHTIINFFKQHEIKTIVDLGCGTGYYTKRFISNGINCEAYDGNPNTEILTEGVGKVLDLSEPFDLQKKFDCVLTLEVGEHIPKEYENIFLDNISRHSKEYIIMSWAVINQGGDGHVNCQNNDYIIDKMKTKEFEYDMKSSNILRNSSTAPWFRNTVMVFKKNN